ncbi:sulfite exporter TauE/SafE family protein [Aquisalimonas sp.]|uniref:sulfite exporter TauE/SafE family protein n=1 Tax=unclassified Aquisalimonas TaxID=2644645 RepID=UPI0025C160B8|nr:sulfite exporter TauE/SafE family protein [Aquisalimonas sp.]
MDHELTLVAALLIGLAGSTHCLGMCGGVAGSLGAGMQSDSPRRRWWLGLCYNLGRIGSYSLIGAIAATLVGVVGATLNLAGWGVFLRLLTAAILIAVAAHLLFNWSGLRRIEVIGGRLWRHIGPRARGLFPVQTPGRALMLGALWGWLPCGLVYTVLIAAAVTGSPLAGAATMFVFGLGTLPAMTGVTVFGQALRRWQGHRNARLVTGTMLMVFGVWTAVTPVTHLLHDHGDGHGEHAAVIIGPEPARLAGPWS